MNEVMWREVMGFLNTPEQRCSLQGVLNPRLAGLPLWVQGFPPGPSVGTCVAFLQAGKPACLEECWRQTRS